MTYNPDIPQDLPSPSIAVDAIRANFSSYANVFDNNHSALNSSTQGKHTNVILQDQSSHPEVDSGFDSLYGKSVVSNSSTNSQIFARLPKFLPNNVPNNPLQLTFNTVSTSSIFQSFLPGGYLLFFGTIPSQMTPINAVINLSPAPSVILCVIPNPTRLVGVSSSLTAPLRLAVDINSSSQFTITSAPIVAPFITGDVNWIAIARQ